jgi:hypothetical protein
LSSILDIDITSKHAASQVTPQIKGEGISELGTSALNHYNKAKAYLRDGDWAGYGRELKDLEEILKKIASRKTEEK